MGVVNARCDACRHWRATTYRESADIMIEVSKGQIQPRWKELRETPDALDGMGLCQNRLKRRQTLPESSCAAFTERPE